MLDMSERALRDFAKRPGTPKPVRIGRTVQYNLQDVQDWLDAQRERGHRLARQQQVGILSKVLNLSRSGDESELSHTTTGKLELHVRGNSEVWVSLEGDDGTVMSFDCFGFKEEGGHIWSTGDITLYKLGGGNEHDC